MSTPLSVTEDAQPNERTPLITANQGNSSHHIQNAGLPEPWVDTFVAKLQAHDLSDTSRIGEEYLSPQTITVPLSRTAFALLVLSQVHRVISGRRTRNTSSEQLGELWHQELTDRKRLDIINKEIQLYWDSFIEDHPSSSEVEHVLWISFPLNQTGQRIRRM